MGGCEDVSQPSIGKRNAYIVKYLPTKTLASWGVLSSLRLELLRGVKVAWRGESFEAEKPLAGMRRGLAG